MNTDRIPRPIPIISMAALMGWLVLYMVFAGTVAAADPAVSTLEFRDSSNNLLNLETGHAVSRVAVDSKGSLYVTDPIMNTLSIFNTNGRMVKQFQVNRASIVAVDSNKGLIYVGGSKNGVQSIFILDNNNNDKGNLGTWLKYPVDMAMSSKGDVYVVDALTSSIKVVQDQGGHREFGPFGGEMYASESVGGFVYTRTRHAMIPEAIAVDEKRNVLYVAATEVVDYLNNVQCTQTYREGTVTGTEAVSSEDTAAAWKYYNDTLKYPTTNAYKWWCPVTVTEGMKYHILIVDMNTGVLIGKAKGETGLNYIGAGFGTLQARGLVFDGKDRLYVAATGGGTVGGGEIRVYYPDTGRLSTSITGFPSGRYFGLAFSPGLPGTDPLKTPGRLFAAVGDSPRVSTFSIDGGANPLNTPPRKPGLVAPVGGSYVKSKTPTLEISNSFDNEGDILTYAYRVSDASGVPASGAGAPEGKGGVTSVFVGSELSENGKYSWTAQSYDGLAVSDWSDVAEFCVNEIEEGPAVPVIDFPKGGDSVSPFSSLLKWSPSTDPDCNDYINNYIVEVSSDPAFLTSVQSATVAGNITSIRLADTAKGLINGASYSWRVKAVDNTGLSSTYSSGSFIYKTTAVRFESDQPGAKVYIDGNYGYNGRLLNGKYDESGNLTGTISLPLEVNEITPGSHFVTFIKAGYEPYHITIDVKDPLSDDGTLTVSASSDKWIKASKITPAVSGTEIFKLSGGNAAPFIVDYNNDGLKDIVAGDGDGRVYLFLAQQDGTMASQGAIYAGPAENRAEINVGSRAVPFVVDYNNDGKKDLLVGSGDGYIYIYKNEGEDSAPVFASSSRIMDAAGQDIKVTSNASPTIIDYNNDGRKDLVVGSSDGTLRLYLNKGTDEAPTFEVSYSPIKASDGSSITATSNSNTFFTDWNNDGKKDLIVGGGSLHLYFNIGSDDAPEFMNLTDMQSWIKQKKRERGNREWIPYLGYNNDLSGLTTGSEDVAPFIVDWGGSATRDIVLGKGSGDVEVLVSE